MTPWSKLALLLLSGIASAQLPKSETLSAADEKLFRAEVAQMDALLADASDKATVSYVMARTWAAAKQWPQAVEWLGKVANLKAGFDPTVFRDREHIRVRRDHGRGARDFMANIQDGRQTGFRPITILKLHL